MLKLPFISDRLSREVSGIVRKSKLDIRIVFSSGSSLKDMLVRSSFSLPICPREEQIARQKKLRGRPCECCACDAGLVGGQCVRMNVVYSMSCAVCGELYVGETERPVHERFVEHYREARAFVARCPWGAHYRANHRDVSTSGIFKPFKDAKLLVSESSLPSRKISRSCSHCQAEASSE